MGSMALILVMPGISPVYSSVILAGIALGGPGILGSTIRGPIAQATVVDPGGGFITSAVDAGSVTAGLVIGSIVNAAVPSRIVAEGIAAPVGLATAPLIAVRPVMPSGIGEPSIDGAVVAGPSGSIVTKRGIGLGGVGPVGLGVSSSCRIVCFSSGRIGYSSRTIVTRPALRAVSLCNPAAVGLRAHATIGLGVPGVIGLGVPGVIGLGVPGVIGLRVPGTRRPPAVLGLGVPGVVAIAPAVSKTIVINLLLMYCHA